MINLIVKKECYLIDYLTNFESLNFNKVQTLLRKKDIKVNGARINTNVELKINDLVQIYTSYNKLFNIEKIYEDENILIVNKPKKLEVVSKTRDISLIRLINADYYAVHRLDFNTEGLVVLAKSKEVKKELDIIFKERLIEKKYYCLVDKVLEKPQKFENFLIKLDGKVKVFFNKVEKSERIALNINPIKNNKKYTLLEVELLTGKTHQIRAQLSFNNINVLGDEKYGNIKLNKLLNLKSQILTAYSLKFNFGKNNKNIQLLEYLDGSEFRLTNTLPEKLFDVL